MNTRPESNGSELTWLSGGGEMGELIRSMDWSKTSLGIPQGWPQSLRTAVSLCLNSTFPILICWGPEDIQIYNDSYRPICGAKHPESMGMNFKICWATALPVVGDAFDRAHQGEGTYINNQRMFLDRFGYLEEAWMTFSFSGIRDESAQIGGVFHPIVETTKAMLSARRTQLLKDITHRMTTALSLKAMADLASEEVAINNLDVPFMAVYHHDVEKGTATLMGGAGLAQATKLLPAEVNLGADAQESWPLHRAIVDRAIVEVDDLTARFGAFTSGPYDNAPEKAMILPLFAAGQSDAYAFVITGVSAARALDEDYRNFFSLLNNAFNAALTNVLAYEQEQKRAKALAEIDRAKTAFFSNVSHEFRTPLTLILGPIEDSLKDEDSPLLPVQRQRQEIVHRNSLRLLKLVNSLLDFSRIEAGRLQANYVRHDLGQMVRDIASSFRSATDRAGLALTIECDELPDDFFVDDDLFEKILLNLISNAFKFTLEGGITITVAKTPTGASIKVTDTGVGIPEAELSKVFERFHRVQGSKGRSFEGTGIGLAMVKELVHLHGGEITVTSTVGEGTTFEFTIPAGSAHLPAEQVESVKELEPTRITSAAFLQEAERWLPAPKFQNENVTVEKPVVIVADDNADMLEYVRSLLAAKFEVHTAVDGLKALELAKKIKPDLILTDVMMPQLDGIGLLQEIRQTPAIAQTAVVLLSARAGEEARMDGLAAGADDYLVKPFSARELLGRLEALLNLDTFRTKENEALIESGKRFHKLFSDSSVNIAYLDLEGRILHVNKIFATSLGYEIADIEGQHFSKFTHPDDVQPNVEQIQRLIAGEVPAVSLEKRYLKSDGENYWVQTSITLFKDEAGQPLHLVAISQYIAARKAAETAAKAALEEANRANAAKSLFLANMSHEIRTPLGIIRGFSELLTEASLVDKERISYAQTILSNSESLGRLINDILDLVKVEAGRTELEIVEFEVKALMKDLESSMRLRTKKDVSFNIKMHASMPHTLRTDPTRLRQILFNVIGNSLKFTERGHVTLEASASNGVSKFTITDTGVGISPEHVHRLFEVFTQGDSSMSRRFGGSGLGLALSRELARALGGDLVLEKSAPGIGSVFSFTIPNQTAHTARANSRIESMPSDELHLEGYKILVAEDSPDNQFLIERYLTKAGAQVVLAHNGEEAIALARSVSHDAILMDIQMPVLDGHHAMRSLRAGGHSCPIIALTAHAMKEERERALREGFDGYLTKPIDRKVLLETLKKFPKKADR